MAGEGSKGASTYLNALLALVTLAGSVYFISGRLTSERPVNPAGSTASFIGEQTLEARLWEDPFKADKSKEKAGQTNYVELLHQTRRRAGNGSLLILPVMLSGGQYGEDQESRIRSRFAVVSGLGRSGYAPEDAEHLGDFNIPWPTQTQMERARRDTNWTRNSFWTYHPNTNDLEGPKIADEPLSVTPPTRLGVRYEWYVRRTFYPTPKSGSCFTNVLVLWLDDSYFEDDPLVRLPLFLEPFCRSGFTNISLIGPRRSSTLRGMLPGPDSGKKPFWERNHVLWQAAAEVLQHVEIFCATPSAMDDALTRTLTNDLPRAAVERALTNFCFKRFHNFAATDSQLASEMLNELALRKLDLTKSNHHLLLISEWDTFYARILSLTYATEIARRQGWKRSARDFIDSYVNGSLDLPANFHSFVYLRGLDGQTLVEERGSKAAAERAERAPTISFEELRKWAPDADKAEGQPQFDYVARLGDQLEATEARLRLEDDQARFAIGIVGSDAYDTLLLLQALNHRFQGQVFFTTDLDARFSHPRERTWSRNLVITSAYGLTLHPSLQGEIAPFRDSTQTAQFAAALAALGKMDPDKLFMVPPRRFEIGNRGPVDISVLDTNKAAAMSSAWIHPWTPQEIFAHEDRPIPWSRCFVLLGHLVGLRSSSDHGDPNDPVIWAVMGTVCAFLLTCLFWEPLRERTFGFRRFLLESLRYGNCDFGGPEGAAIFIDRLADTSNPLATALAGELGRLRKPLDLSPLPSPPTSKPAGIAAAHTGSPTEVYHSLLLQQAEATKTAAESLRAQEDFQNKRSERANALVHSFNGILSGSEQFSGSFEETAKSDAKVYKKVLRTIMGAWQNRRFLDSLLDDLSGEIREKESPLSAAAGARTAAHRLFYWRAVRVIVCLAGVAALALLSVQIANDVWTDLAQRPTSEPFSFVNGVSSWPPMLLRLAAVLLSWYSCFLLYSRMRCMFYDLTRYYRFPFKPPEPKRFWVRVRSHFAEIRNSFVPFQSHSASQSSRPNVADLWAHFHEFGDWVGRLIRAGIPTMLYFLFSTVIFQLFGAPSQSMRGTDEDSLHHWARFMMPGWPSWPIKPFMVVNISFVFLTFLTLDSALRCRRFIGILSERHAEFPEATRAHFRRQRGGVAVELLDDWIGIRLVADLTERVGRSLWMPGIVFLFLLIARFSWWDTAPWHAAHIIIMSLNFCIAIASVLVLQRSARDAKQAAEDRLAARIKALHAQSAPSKIQNDAAQAEKLLDEIRGIRRGAFVPFWESPVLGALMVGPGGLTVLQMIVWLLNR